MMSSGGWFRVKNKASTAPPPKEVKKIGNEGRRDVLQAEEKKHWPIKKEKGEKKICIRNSSGSRESKWQETLK